jgi:hypothetical protein
MLQKIKNSWLYEWLDNLELLIDDNRKSLTLETLVNIVIIPFMITAGLVIFCLLPFLLLLSIPKDIFDWYYNKHAERIQKEFEIKAKIEINKKVEKWLKDYQQRLNNLNDLYYLKKRKIVEDPLSARPFEDSNKSFFDTSDEIIEVKSEQGRIPHMIHMSMEQERAFSRALHDSWITNNEKSRYNNILNKDVKFVKLEVDEVISKHSDYKQFILEFLRNYNSKHYTYSSYKNQQICDSNRRRSMFDIYLITKYYYPEVTFEMVVDSLIFFVKTKAINTSYCNTVQKYVFYVSSISYYNNLNNKLENDNMLTMDNLINYFTHEK